LDLKRHIWPAFLSRLFVNEDVPTSPENDRPIDPLSLTLHVVSEIDHLIHIGECLAVDLLPPWRVSLAMRVVELVAHGVNSTHA
jgi:hypothetical protein